MRRWRWKLLFSVALVALVAVIVSVALALPTQPPTPISVAELLLRSPALIGQETRIQGELVRRTLSHVKEPCLYSFQLRSGTSVVAVRFSECVVPDTLRDSPGVSVIADGELQPDLSFLASDLLAIHRGGGYQMRQAPQSR